MIGVVTHSTRAAHAMSRCCRGLQRHHICNGRSQSLCQALLSCAVGAANSRRTNRSAVNGCCCGVCNAYSRDRISHSLCQALGSSVVRAATHSKRAPHAVSCCCHCCQCHETQPRQAEHTPSAPKLRGKSGNRQHAGGPCTDILLRRARGPVEAALWSCSVGRRRTARTQLMR